MATKASTMTIAYQLDNIKVSRARADLLTIPALTIAKGQCIALTGKNGAGKSTLLDLLAFVTTPSKGTIYLAGSPVTKPLNRQQRRMIAYVSQHPYLLAGKVADNLALALSLQGIKRAHQQSYIEKALAQMDISHLMGQPVHTLSGGEIKRVAIARAISYQPDILLLDEPFSHLDKYHSKQLETLITAMIKTRKHTIILTTHHSLQGMTLADKTVHLVDGYLKDYPLLNLLPGSFQRPIFHTGKINIHATSTLDNARFAAIDPHDIIISSAPLQSSMRNQFNGRLTLIAEQGQSVRLTIDCGHTFHAIISHDALSQLKLSLGETVWLSFKSTAVTLF